MIVDPVPPELLAGERVDGIDAPDDVAEEGELGLAAAGTTTGVRTSALVSNVQRMHPVLASSAYTMPFWLPTYSAP